MNIDLIALCALPFLHPIELSEPDARAYGRAIHAALQFDHLLADEAAGLR